MTGHLTQTANLARQHDMHADAAASRRAVAVRPAGDRVSVHTPEGQSITIRRANDVDQDVLERLAALDSARMLSGEVLIGEVDDEPYAAIEIATGATVADPFRATARVVDLLCLRATMLREQPTWPRRLRLRTRRACRAI
jgi:hypothetical protein